METQTNSIRMQTTILQRQNHCLFHKTDGILTMQLQELPDAAVPFM